MGTLGTILSVVGGIGSLIFGIQMLILAFKKSVGWGLASLLIPFVIFIFVAQNWAACKTPFLRWLACFGVMAIGYAITGAAMFSGAMAGAGQ
ncbi:MAG: hypothetical protein AB7G12_15045 [Thermoanaerobaculia bacterium]